MDYFESMAEARSLLEQVASVSPIDEDGKPTGLKQYEAFQKLAKGRGDTVEMVDKILRDPDEERPTGLHSRTRFAISEIAKKMDKKEAAEKAAWETAREMEGSLYVKGPAKRVKPGSSEWVPIEEDDQDKNV